MNTRGKVHELINKERKHYGSPRVRWNGHLAKLARSQAKYCAKVHHMVHSDRFAFKGGENLAEGGRRFSPEAIVSCWMHSHEGHREYLLSPRVTQAGVGIAKTKDKTYVAWAFSDEPVKKHKKLRLPKINSPFRGLGSLVRLLLACVAVMITILGAHGVYTYFSRGDLLLGSFLTGMDSWSKLFLAITVPDPLRPYVLWMTIRGMQSWIIPGALIGGGVLLWRWRSRIVKAFRRSLK